MNIYADNAATTKMSENAIHTMVSLLDDSWGNPSSLYAHGQMAKEVLEKVGLSHRVNHKPSQLSGGQCQRVAIARAIVGNPEIILADEPCGNLDSKMGAEIMELLQRLNREEGKTVVMVTHNEEQARRTDRIVRFFDGRQVL